MSSKPTLNTTNPEALAYSSGNIHFTLLGGIRLEGLDRLRATVKIEANGKAIRHNLDLYNDTQTEKLIRRAAEKLEAGTSFIGKALGELTNQLEAYRLEELARAQVKQETRKPLTKEEIKAAKSFLTAPALMERTSQQIGRAGVIGEESNRLLMYLIFTSRKREHPLHIISLGSSGTGKTYLQEKVGELIPEEDKVEITTLSDNAFYYFGQRELSNKLILIEDLDGAENVLYPLRELQSKKRISKTVAHKDSRGNTKTVHLTVEGPVSVAGCTTKERIYEDNANRSFLIYLDESEEQDEKIMDYQRAVSAGQIDHRAEDEIKELLKNCQRILKPITVRNPYAPLLKIPAEVFKPRRTNAHYLAFIEAVTFYHQYQREEKTDPETGEQYIETTLADIEAANTLMKEILLRKSDELSGACRNYFERVKRWLKEEKKTAFTNKQARAVLRENHSNQKRYMLQLQQENLLRRSQGDKKKGFYYEVVSMEEYEQLRAGITGVLDEIFLKLSQVVQSSKEVHKDSEPLNGSNSKENSKKFKSSGKGVSGEENIILSPATEAVQPDQGAQHTYQQLAVASQSDPGKSFTAAEASQLTGKNRRTVNRYLKKLAEAGLLERQLEEGKYTYRIKR